MDVRERIIRAAIELLASGGREAVSTRAVSAAAGVQAPTIYRQFGDMQGLLDAVARETFTRYVSQKATQQYGDDPVEDMRRGWDLHIEFALANPGAYALMYGDPFIATDASAAREAEAILQGLLNRAAEAGRLKVSVPYAAGLVAAGGRGVALSLINTPPDDRDPRLSHAMREAILAAITTAQAPETPATQETARVSARAVALRAVLGEAPDVLSPAERQLMGEWLDRLSDG
jgi:AcrR family transcriptional regulator